MRLSQRTRNLAILFLDEAVDGKQEIVSLIIIHAYVPGTRP